MVRFNLQLFAKSVDAIAKEVIKGNWGNGDTRKTKLTNAGYDYSTVQARVNEMLKGGTTGSAKTTNNTPTTKTTPAPQTTEVKNDSSAPVIKGVDNSLVETIGSTFNQSDNTTALQQGKDDAAQAYKNFASNTDIISADVWAGMSTAYSKSSAVLQAEQLLQSKIDQGYAGTHKEALNNLLNDFMNREDFEYDVDKDTMFQQALASAMSSGKTAMQDTIGQASALTGGYGSTYATTAGNQAYNAFIEDAYSNLPEYYNMALAAYEAEGQQMLQQYNMLDAADTKEYNQWYDDINLTYQRTRDMVNDEYNQWNANNTMYTNLANMQLSENAQIGNNLYNMYNISSNEYESAYTKDWNNWQQSIDSAYKMANLQSSDYWNTEDMNFRKSESEREQSNWQTSFDYQKDQDKQAQSNWQKSYEADLKASGLKLDKNGNVVVDENAYTGWINPDDVEVDENGNVISIEGMNIAGADGGDTSPASIAGVTEISGFRSKEGDNFKVTVGDKTYKVENKGKVNDTDTINRLNRANAKNDEVINMSGDLYVKHTNGYYKVGATGGLFNLWDTNGYTKLLGSLN